MSVVTSVLLLTVSMTASATTIDLTSAGASGTLDGNPGGIATFLQGATLSGTGVFPAFVQIAGNNLIHDAYNTTVNNVNDNGASSVFNHEIRLSDIPIFTLGGVSYYSFFLDINESDTATDRYLSLDKLTVLTSTTANQSTEELPTAIGTITRWDMGAGDNIILNYSLEPGSGRADMEFLVRVSDFAGALPTDFVYLYSRFGALGVDPAGLPPGNYNNSDGFEEWSLGRSNTVVPEPNALVLLGTGLIALAARRRFSGK
jgi:hypothetical protein